MQHLWLLLCSNMILRQNRKLLAGFRSWEPGIRCGFPFLETRELIVSCHKMKEKIHSYINVFANAQHKNLIMRIHPFHSIYFSADRSKIKSKYIVWYGISRATRWYNYFFQNVILEYRKSRNTVCIFCFPEVYTQSDKRLKKRRFYVLKAHILTS